MFANGFTAETRADRFQSGFAESGGEGEGARQRATRRVFCCRARTPSKRFGEMLEPAPSQRLRDARCANADASERSVIESNWCVIHSREAAKDSAALAPISLRRASPKASYA